MKSFKNAASLGSLDGTEGGAIWNGENGPIHSEEEQQTSNSDEGKIPIFIINNISIRYF